MILVLGLILVLLLTCTSAPPAHELPPVAPREPVSRQELAKK